MLFVRPFQNGKKDEQLAIKNRRSKLILKIVLGIIIGFVVINILLVIVGAISLSLVGGEGKVTVTNISDQIMQDE